MSKQLLDHPFRNLFLAVGMMLFLALSFRIGGDLSTDTTVSQTDSVVSTLNQPTQVTTVSHFAE